MNKIIGNYIGQPNSDFPLDCETLEYIKSNTALVEVLGNIAGDKTIISGCEVIGHIASEGYIFVKTAAYPQGELLFFGGGDISDGVYLITEAISINANSNNYRSAYTKRYLDRGLGGDEHWDWNEFKFLKNVKTLTTEVDRLDDRIDALVGNPIGTILIYPGEDAPNNYKICDGSSLDKDDYQDLFYVIGYIYSLGVTSGNTFRIPNMQGKFVAGMQSNDSSHNVLGKTGGASEVTLLADQSGLPAHSHGILVYEHSSNYDQATKPEDGNAGRSKTVYTDQCTAKDASKAHENLPPYITMNYIIKVK